MPRHAIEKIISGGQTGADRAALEWAIGNGIAHGGWCPAGRHAEDGPVPPIYQLKETPAHHYRQRTVWNVRDSDATLILTLDAYLEGGSATTAAAAQRLNRPCLHLHAGNASPQVLREFIARHHVRTLNVAGPRESKAPDIAAFVIRTLTDAFSPDRDAYLQVMPAANRFFTSPVREPYRVFRLVANNPASPEVKLPKRKREALSQPENPEPREPNRR